VKDEREIVNNTKCQFTLRAFFLSIGFCYTNREKKQRDVQETLKYLFQCFLNEFLPHEPEIIKRRSAFARRKPCLMCQVIKKTAEEWTRKTN
jgi:hypothetical protein